MKIKILGTAAAEGIPGIFCTCGICENARRTGGKNVRTRSQSIINDRYLVDFPPDTYLHAIKHNLKLAGIEHAVITHHHEDHFYPDELEYRRPPFGYNSEYPPLNIYGPQAVKQKYLELRNKVNDAQMEDYVKIHELKAFETYRIGELDVTPLPALHARDAECFIYIIESEGKRLLYGHDSGFFPEAGMRRIRSLRFDCVILDCTTGIEPDGNNHMGVDDDIAVRRGMLAAGCADEKTIFIMSHFSHNGKLTHEQLEEIGVKNGFLVAYDGFEAEF